VTLLLADCSSTSIDESSPSRSQVAANATSGTGPATGGISYTWDQISTSSNSTPSNYLIHISSGWKRQQASADIVAVYIADKVDDSFGDTAPITLTFDCTGGEALAHGIYVRNIGGSVDITWQSYTETGGSC